LKRATDDGLAYIKITVIWKLIENHVN